MSSSDTLVTKTFNGIKCEINVHQDGWFHSRANGEYFKAETLVELVKILKKECVKTKIEVAIPATLMNVEPLLQKSHYGGNKYGETTCKPVTLIGIDHRNEEVKYRDAEGHVHTMGRGGGILRGRDAELGKPMTPEEIKTWQELLKAKLKAEDAFRKFNDKFAFKYGGAEKLVKAAQGVKVDTPVEPEDDEADEDPR